MIGPLRARADLRFALEVPQRKGSASDGTRRDVADLWETLRGARPSLLETVFGADWIIPGTEGSARASVWYSPVRREGMAELRLF